MHRAIRTTMVTLTAMILITAGCQEPQQKIYIPQMEIVRAFDGENMDNWAIQNDKVENKWKVVGDVGLDPQDPTQLTAQEGAGIMTNAPDGHSTNIYTDREFSDCEVSLEFMVPQEGNSGVYLMGRYEVQILDSFGQADLTGGDCGGIYPRWIDGRNVGGHPPMVNACSAPGTWQRLEIRFQAPRFDASGNKVENARFIVVRLNDVAVQRDAEVDGPTRSSMLADEQPMGPLMLQGDHSAVAYRNVVIKYLKPAPTEK